MSEKFELARKMPLEGSVIAHEGLTIRPVLGRGKILLQRSNSVADSEMETLGQKFVQTFGTGLPLNVCDKTVSKDSAITVLCLNPSSWIIICDEDDVGTIMGWFEEAAQAATITTSDMTDQYICLDIRGSFARSLLAKGCALDLAEESFSENHVARSLLAQANIVIWRHDSSYRIIFDVSLCDYLWLWLEGASTEFAVRKL